MYLRYHTWQPVIRFISQTQGGWVNEFALDYPCIDIRMNLRAYGWKPNQGDQNIPVLYEGVYKCYFRKQGTTDWLLFARVVVERAATEDPTVYRDVSVTTGEIAEEMYEVKIEATEAQKYEAWGGFIEGITKGGGLWYGLQFRAARPLEINVTDDAFVRDWTYEGKDPIDMPTVFDNVAAWEDYIYFLGLQINVTDALVTITEVPTLYQRLDRSIVDVVFNTEYFATWWNNIGVWQGLDIIWIDEFTVIQRNPLQFYNPVYDQIPTSEFRSVVIPLLYIPLKYETINVVERIAGPYPVPPWPIWAPEENFNIAETFAAEVNWFLLKDEGNELASWTISVTGWGAVVENPSGVAYKFYNCCEGGTYPLSTDGTAYIKRNIKYPGVSMPSYMEMCFAVQGFYCAGLSCLMQGCFRVILRCEASCVVYAHHTIVFNTCDCLWRWYVPGNPSFIYSIPTCKDYCSSCWYPIRIVYCFTANCHEVHCGWFYRWLTDHWILVTAFDLCYAATLPGYLEGDVLIGSCISKYRPHRYWMDYMYAEGIA